jgi:hypothetical protein
MLTAQWTRKLPFIQETAPAELAARLIHAFLDDFPDIDSEQYFVIDFCSGAGGEQIHNIYDLAIAMSIYPPHESSNRDLNCRNTQSFSRRD